MRTELRRIETCAVAFESIPDLPWPASVAGLRLDGSPGIIHHLEWERYGVDVILLTLVWLLALGAIEVVRAIVQKTVLGIRVQQKAEFLLRACKQGPKSADGWLEGKVLEAASLRDVRISSNIEYPGALIDDVVWSIISSRQPWPAHEVIYFVAVDAKRRGLGTVHGLVGPEFDPDPTHLAALRKAQEDARALMDQLRSVSPDLHHAMASGCRRGLQSRTQVVLPDYA